MPDGLLEILKIPGVGPRTVKLLHEERGIDSVDALRAAAADGQLRGIKGLSERTEQNILAGIARLEQKVTRVLLHEADEMIGGLIARLRDVPGVVRIEPAGSLRRRKATIGDLDLLAATENPQELIAALDGLTEVDRILSAGTDKSSIVLGAGLQVDLMVCPPAAWGTHLVHFTGSKEHNVALRGMALDRGLTLSEKGFKVVETGELLLDDTEEAVYARLDLPWIPPEMREDTDVIEVARKGKPARADHRGRSEGRHARALGLDRWRGLDRGHGARLPRSRTRVDGADRSLALAGRGPRADARAHRGAEGGDRPAQRRVRAVPHPARHRDGDPRRRQPGLPR